MTDPLFVVVKCPKCGGRTYGNAIAKTTACPHYHYGAACGRSIPITEANILSRHPTFRAAIKAVVRS